MKRVFIMHLNGCFLIHHTVVIIHNNEQLLDWVRLLWSFIWKNTFRPLAHCNTMLGKLYTNPLQTIMGI